MINRLIIHIDSMESKKKLEEYMKNETGSDVIGVGELDIGGVSKVLIMNEDFSDMDSLSAKESVHYEGMKFSNVDDFIKWHKYNHKICCGFKYNRPVEEAFGRGFTLIKKYGSCNSKRNIIHTCDSGERRLYRCKGCGCYVLVQESEMWSTDNWYEDYIPVYSEEHADYVNERYGGYEIENIYTYKTLFKTNGKAITWH